MKKQALSLALSGALLFSTVSASSFPYQDVASFHWAYNYIQTATERGWFQGNEAGLFNPDNAISKAEVAKLLTVATNLETVELDENAYSDIENSWAKDFINATAHLFLDTATLTQPDNFSPTQSITRGETILAMVLAYNHDVSTANVDFLDFYSDVDLLPDALLPYTATSIELGLVTGKVSTDNIATIDPDATLTRGEFAALLVRAEAIGFGSSDVSETETQTETQDETDPSELDSLETDLGIDDGDLAETQEELLLDTEPTTPVELEDEVTEEVVEETEEELDIYVSFVNEVLELVNSERAAIGVAPLILDPLLCEAATYKSNEMSELNYFSHTSPIHGSPFDMMAYFGITYRTAAENIAQGQRTPSSVMNSWMNSPGHCANILNGSYGKIGIGISDTGYYWTQMFTN